MAKSTSFFTHRRGSTKSHTYQVNMGMQITKDRAGECKNPRSLTQMEHRCLIHTMSDAHSWLRQFFGNLWNGAPAGAKQLAAFREANFEIIKDAAFGGLAGFTYSPYKVNTVPMGYFQVAHGALPYHGHLFQNGVDGLSEIYTEMFNSTMADQGWYDTLAGMGLKVGDTVALFLIVYNPEQKTFKCNAYGITFRDIPDFIIGQQGEEVVVTVQQFSNDLQWYFEQDANRIMKFSISPLIFNRERDVLITSCFQIKKSTKGLICSDGYLWHWADNVLGLHFREALATYPGENAANNVAADEDVTIYVDMGMPSGILWGTRNLDVTQAAGLTASIYTYKASFFSWGNVDGHNPTSNSSFAPWDWGGINENEPYYRGQVYGDTKGNTLQTNIPVDTEYDAARNILGGSWRMPSREDFVELLANCSFINADGQAIPASQEDKRITLNAIVGIYLESQINGARLFLPCSGSGEATARKNRATTGLYWSSRWNGTRAGRCLLFKNGQINANTSYLRCNGLTIRPVLVPLRGGLPINDIRYFRPDKKRDER